MERLDKYWHLNNEIGRPLAHTLVLTGIPALYAKVTGTPLPFLLIPMTFLATQYAVLSGRFLVRPFIIPGWVFAGTFVLIWVGFYFV
jgi:hypothetical protein